MAYVNSSVTDGGGDLQALYNISTDPEFITDAIRGAITIRRGSAADTDNVLEIQNGAGSTTASITGEGEITGTDFIGITQPMIAQQINAQTGTAYTLVDADHGKLITLDNASAITLTLNTGLRSDFACAILQKGAGVVTISGSATLNEFDGFTSTAGQWALASISNLGSDVYFAQGRMA